MFEESVLIGSEGKVSEWSNRLPSSAQVNDRNVSMTENNLFKQKQTIMLQRLQQYTVNKNRE